MTVEELVMRFGDTALPRPGPTPDPERGQATTKANFPEGLLFQLR